VGWRPPDIAGTTGDGVGWRPPDIAGTASGGAGCSPPDRAGIGGGGVSIRLEVYLPRSFADALRTVVVNTRPRVGVSCLTWLGTMVVARPPVATGLTPLRDSVRGWIRAGTPLEDAEATYVHCGELV